MIKISVIYRSCASHTKKIQPIAIYLALHMTCIKNSAFCDACIQYMRIMNEIFENLQKFLKICKNLNNHKKSLNVENLEKSWKSSKISKNLENLENIKKSWKISRFQKYQIFNFLFENCSIFSILKKQKHIYIYIEHFRFWKRSSLKKKMIFKIFKISDYHISDFARQCLYYWQICGIKWFSDFFVKNILFFLVRKSIDVMFIF